LRERVEVVVERFLAGHRDGEGRVTHVLGLLDKRFGLVVVEERERDHRRMAVLRDESAVARVEIRARATESRDLGIVDERPDKRLELRRVDRAPVGANHDDVRDGARRITRERARANVLGSLRLGIVRRRALRREAAAQKRGDRRHREHGGGDPAADRPPWVAGGGTG
jgi:hypothetical protein